MICPSDPLAIMNLIVKYAMFPTFLFFIRMGYPIGTFYSYDCVTPKASSCGMSLHFRTGIASK